MQNNYVSEKIHYIGVNDHVVDLFEGQYVVKNGMSYNSYLIEDEKIAVVDTVDIKFTHEWLDNIENKLNGRTPDYLIILHMEPDHSANISNFLDKYPNVTVVGNQKTFVMMKQFFPKKEFNNVLVVNEMDTLNLGEHTLTFVFAPMVHWPEVMVAYESKNKVLFSADGFGKFGALDRDEEWDDEARRYYIGIVGKYGAQVQALLAKAATLDIKIIAPLHGPILNENLGHYISLYDKWSSYTPEEEGIVLAYTSVYGNTKKAVELLEEELKKHSVPKIVKLDLARTDISHAVAMVFKYSRIVLATTTYNMELFPFMNNFIHHLVERNFQNRLVGIIENGTWAPLVEKLIKEKFNKSKEITFTNTTVKIKSSVNDNNLKEIASLAQELSRGYESTTSKKEDLNALFNIGYGLYVVTSKDGNKDNGLIVNTVTQLTSTPNRVGVTINKLNYSCYVIEKTKKMNVNVLSTDTPFEVFEKFGFQSGRNVDKFKNETILRSNNGLTYLSRYINSYLSLDVVDSVDLGTHMLFICDVYEAEVLSNKPTMTYAYYHEHVKPKPTASKGYVCEICGYVYQGDTLPDDYICPLCKHGASDFKKLD